jgi:formylglycine-generating enzyme required for sulfatase activity
MRPLILQTTCFVTLFFLTLLISNPAQSNPKDYHPETGEPKCMSCHTSDRKYSIDYTRQESCAECHGSGLSDRYLSLNNRHRASVDSDIEEPMMIAKSLADKKIVKSSSKNKSTKGMALVPAGPYTMGSNDWWPKSQPEHTKYLEAFYMDKFEVTNRRYKEYVDATGYKHPKHWMNGLVPPDRIDHPVTYVNWFDADNFCRWEGKRLPTEAEWEKAARGTDKRTFPWGDEFDKNKGNTPQYGHGDTMDVGSFPDGASPYGIQDMAGNAFEWTADWFKAYPGNAHPDENYGELYKSIRGGSWYDCTYYKCGISAPTYNRIFFNPYTLNNTFGFRCVKDKE